LKSSEVDRYF